MFLKNFLGSKIRKIVEVLPSANFRRKRNLIEWVTHKCLCQNNSEDLNLVNEAVKWLVMNTYTLEAEIGIWTLHQDYRFASGDARYRNLRQYKRDIAITNIASILNQAPWHLGWIDMS